MSKILKSAYTFAFVAFAFCITSKVSAQIQLSGSASVENEVRSINGTTATTAESLYIGPDANISIPSGAVWEIYSKNIWISPTATITGPGTMIIYSPSANGVGGTAGSTIIDGNNGNYITANVKVLNNQGIKLQTISRPSDLGSWNSGDANLPQTTLKLGANLDLAVDGANVWLGGTLSDDVSGNKVGDLNFSSAGTLTATGGSLGTQRMIVTNNSSLSHLVKTQGGSSFLYPVGIAAGDYTPATITANTTEHVSVVDYTQRTNYPVINVPAEGMYRTWHVYGGSASSVTLVHNTSTNGTLYTDNQAFITRYAGGAQWTYSGTVDYVSAGVHTNAATIPSGISSDATANASWLTKSSDKISPLPVKFADFTATIVNNQALLKWSTATEINNAGFTVERSSNGLDWQSIGTVASLAKGGNSSIQLDYSYTDENPLSGVNYYRIKQTDLDNAGITYSEIRNLTFQSLGDIKVYPNPAVSSINIANVTIGNQIRVIGMDGKVYASEIINRSPQQLNVSNLSSGVYIIQILKDRNIIGTVKFIKK